MTLIELRVKYHQCIGRQLLFVKAGIPNIADTGNKGSVAIAKELVASLDVSPQPGTHIVQTTGTVFEQITGDFLAESFRLLHHLRPGNWVFSIHRSIAEFEQYSHLADLQNLLKHNVELAATLGGDYLITPDIVIGRSPVVDNELNQNGVVIGAGDNVGTLTPLLSRNRSPERAVLHASISCKWTIRSDRVQNTRTEALNLIRNRKGHTPHVAAVTAEPLPTRIASLALGTGDLDCVYHFALHELRAAVNKVGNEDQQEMLNTMINGRRLRDISDLPLDLAV